MLFEPRPPPLDRMAVWWLLQQADAFDRRELVVAVRWISDDKPAFEWIGA